jgi:hypothetical protein
LIIVAHSFHIFARQNKISFNNFNIKNLKFD